MSKRAGIQEVAAAAGVSIGTVDRALHGRSGISGATCRRVMRAAQELGYRPNLAARALSGKKRRIRIAVCMPREIHYFYDQLWAGVYAEAELWADFGVEFVHHPLKELGARENVADDLEMTPTLHSCADESHPVAPPGRRAEVRGEASERDAAERSMPRVRSSLKLWPTLASCGITP